MSTDVASLRLSSEENPERLARFSAAIEAARRLGFDVILRIVDDPHAARLGQKVPLDIYAEAIPRTEKLNDS